MSPEDEIMLAVKDFKDAVISCNYNKLDDLLDKDYKSINLAGHTENRNLVLEFYGKQKVLIEKYEIDDLSIIVEGNIGIVTGKGFIRGRFGSEIWEHDLRFCDIFKKHGSEWKLFFSQGTPIIKL